MDIERPRTPVSPSEAKAQLAQTCAGFRDRMERAGAKGVWEVFSGTIGVLLPGGGARGAYEAGVLLAFQDAALPTHIIAATSVGCINAASFASRSETEVGNAEHLVESWFDLTPPAAGIEWTRYAWMLAGLIAASAGFGNLLSYLLIRRGLQIHLHDPALTWFALGLAGAAVLLLYDNLPYLSHVVRNMLRATAWVPDRRKIVLSLVANLVVWGFLILVFHSLHFHIREYGVKYSYTLAAVMAAVLLALLALLRHVVRAPLSALLHRILRLPLRTGLFQNFERGRLLRRRISVERLHASPIRLIFTATDLESGAGRYFSNATPERLAAAPGADRRFIAEEVSMADDLLRVAIASSAMPLVYEPIRLGGHLYTDGAIVSTQPTRPVIRLGADLLFVVMMDPPEGRYVDVKTFIDVGLRSLDILMSQNLLTDLKVVRDINLACERAAAEIGVRPEDVEIDLGTRRFRYLRVFTIRPTTPLAGTTLDFDGETIGQDILRGYRDACVQLEEFLAYAREARFGLPRHILRFAPEHDPSRAG